MTTDGTKTAYDIRNITAYSVYVAASGGTSADVSYEGTADPAGENGFSALAYRLAGGGSYATTADSLSAGDEVSHYFDPSDNVCWIRMVVANQSGPTTLNAFLSGEA